MPRLRTLQSRLGRIDQRTAHPAPKVADPVYQTSAHRAWARAVIARDGGRCQWPGCDRAAPEYQVVADHCVEVKDGGALHDVSNGQCLCVRHNTIKGAQARAARYAVPVVPPIADAGAHPDLVDQLPAGGAAIIVRQADVGRAIRAMIINRRGQGLADNCRVLTIRDHDDLYQLIGLRCPVVVDRSFTASAPPELLAEVSVSVAQILAAQPAPAPR